MGPKYLKILFHFIYVKMLKIYFVKTLRHETKFSQKM